MDNGVQGKSSHQRFDTINEGLKNLCTRVEALKDSNHHLIVAFNIENLDMLVLSQHEAIPETLGFCDKK